MKHSPLGGSGAARFIACPGSVSLASDGVINEDGTTGEMFDFDDDTYSAPGTAAHILAQRCLATDIEAWETIGKFIDNEKGTIDDKEGILIDREMTDGVTEYVNSIQKFHLVGKKNGDISWLEHSFHCPDLHQHYYGTCDYMFLDRSASTLHVWDFKYGVGIVVEAENNAQAMYYAAGAMEELDLWDEVDNVVLHISQPRAFHWQGSHRYHKITTEYLDDWLTQTLLPAMDLALVSRETKAGDHCRFCPVRYYHCPSLDEAILTLEELILKAQQGVTALTNEEVGHLLNLGDIFGPVKKAVTQMATARAEKGQTIPGYKLAKGMSKRAFREGAEEAAIEDYGENQVFTESVMISPAVMEKLPMDKKFTAKWASKTDGGLTLAKDADTRAAVTPEKVASVFKDHSKG